MLDYLIVGAGLTGAVVAHELRKAGRSVAVIEKRAHIGGNCYDEVRDGIRVSLYGGHIFHTNSRRIWDYLSQFTAWQAYEHRVKASYYGTIYSFPPNRMTLQQLGVQPGPEAEHKIRETFFRGYTEKQWGRRLEDVPGSIIKRIPVRDNWDDRYFADDYQGLPADGYTAMIGRMLEGVPVTLEADYLGDREYWRTKARRVIYTGPVDALYDNDLGRLEYRSLCFKHTKYDLPDWQGCATLNYTAASVPFTRTMEWKYFWRTPALDYTWVTHEWPADYDGANEPYYPVGDDANTALYREYRERADADGYIVAGRLGAYRYYNMDQCVGAALALVERIS
jgi:UDP-galactopyranose mutase